MGYYYIYIYITVCDDGTLRLDCYDESRMYYIITYVQIGSYNLRTGFTDGLFGTYVCGDTTHPSSFLLSPCETIYIRLYQTITYYIL